MSCYTTALQLTTIRYSSRCSIITAKLFGGSSTISSSSSSSRRSGSSSRILLSSPAPFTTATTILQLFRPTSPAPSPSTNSKRTIMMMVSHPSSSSRSMLQHNQQRLLQCFNNTNFDSFRRRLFSTLPPHEIVGLPSLSPTMETGSISVWNVKAGDKVVAGDVFASIETDKAVVDFEAQDDGIVAQILVSAGTEVAVNAPVMILVTDPNDVKAFENYKVPDTVEATVAVVAAPPPVAAPVIPTPATTVTPLSPISSTSGGGGSVFASPLARKLAQEMGYDIAIISGTGPSGRIIAADVKEYKPVVVAAAAATAAPPTQMSATTPTPIPMSAPVAGSGFIDYPIPASVSDVAARLAQSKRNVPHYYLTVDINADALIKLRNTMNAQLSAGGSKKDGSTVETLGVYEYIIKAAGLSMRTIPSANAAWMETHVRVYDSVDVNIVMGAGESLHVRTIRNVAGIGLKSIMNELTKDEHGDTIDDGLGTFTMVNVGMYGVKSCAPIIREPQACAIAIGALQHRIIPAVATNNDTTDKETIGYQQSVMFTVTASFDHRVVDGAVGAQWLSALKSYIEHPSTLLL